MFDAGSNRDGDELLEPLCEDWLQIKGQLTSKKALLFFSLWLCAGNIFEMLIDNNLRSYVLRLGPYCELRAKFFEPGICYLQCRPRKPG